MTQTNTGRPFIDFTDAQLVELIDSLRQARYKSSHAGDRAMFERAAQAALDEVRTRSEI